VSDFVDPADPRAVEDVLAKALPAIGIDGVLAQLDAVVDLEVVPPRAGGLFASRRPGAVSYGDRRLVLDDRPVLEHIVGGVVVARDAVTRGALPGMLAALVCRSVAESGAADQVSVLLTALRDATAIS
jgi:hypothetical protein